MSTYTNSNKQIVTAFYNGQFISKGYINNKIVLNSNLVTLTINPTPSDAEITFSNYGAGIISGDGKSITVRKGNTIEYTIQKQGYFSEANTISNLQVSQTINVELCESHLINIEDYRYSLNNTTKVVTLLKYTSNKTDVVVPELI